MMAPATLPDALAEIEELRGQVRELTRLIGQNGQGKTGAADQVEDSPVDHPQKRDTFLREIVEGTAAATGAEFFRSLVHHLAKALTVRYAFIGEWHEDRPDTIRMLAIWSRPAFGEPFDYNLRGTPCINVVGREFCFYGNGVQQRFPEDRLLVEMGIDSYCGIPLFGQSANPLGLLVVMDDRPMANTTVVRDLLTIFAARAAAELERVRAEQARSQALADLRNIIDSIPDVLFTLDLRGNLVRWNHTLERVTGYSANELLNKHALEFVLPAEQEPTASAIHQAFRDGYAEVEGLLLTKDGRTIPYHWTGARLQDPQGRMIGLIGVGRNITELKRSEEALRMSEERYARATVIGKVGVWELDVATGRYYGDINLKTLFGYGPDELSTDPYVWLGLIHPEDQSIALKAWEGIVSGSTDDYHYELRTIRKDRSIIWTDVRGRAERDERGTLLRLIGATVDITDRKQAETEARRNHVLLSAIMDASIDHISVKDLDGRYIHMNRSGANALGMPNDEIIGWDDVALWGSESAASLRAGDRRVVESGETITAEESLMGEGKATVYLTTKAPYRDPEGRIIGVIRVARNITERKQAEETLRQSETRFRSLFENSPISYQSLDQEGRFIDVNPRLCQLLGYEREELIGREFGDLWPDERQSDFSKTFASFMQTGKVRNELALRRRDGTIVNAVIDGRIQCDADGKFVRTHCILTDISERKEAEDALRRSEVRLNEAQRLAHIGSWELDLLKNCLTWSDEMFRIFEIDQDRFGLIRRIFGPRASGRPVCR